MVDLLSYQARRNNMENLYRCECGREFTKPNSFNGHKSQCKIHLGEEKYNARIVQNKLKWKQAGKKATLICSQKSKEMKAIYQCPICKINFIINLNRKSNKKYCSHKCANIALGALRYDASKHIKQIKAKYTGPQLPQISKQNYPNHWLPRNKITYAELFWKRVLDNNKINYEHDFKVKCEPGRPGVYRLDFKIEDIDLEIDGSVHLKKEIIEKDMRRTIYLESLGYKIYRIKWINPINDKNKEIVNNQINDLFKFLNIARIA